MANLHSVAVTGPVTITTTTETVLATIGPFTENQPGGEGISVSGLVNLTTGAGTTSLTIRVRQGTSGTGSVVGAARTVNANATVSLDLTIAELDPTTVQVGASYCVTVQQGGATANGTANRVILNCQDATAFE